MLIVHRDHGLALKKEVHFSELDNEPFILYRKDFTLYDLIIEECSKNHFQPNIVCESSQKDFLLGMVEGKMGIALLPSKICKNISNDEIAVIPLVQSNVNLELGMIWKKNKYLPFTVREFITTSRQYLELES